MSLLRPGQWHILQPHLPLRHRLPIRAPRDGDAPELLYAPLKHRLSDDVYRSLTHRAQEVGRVVDADGELSLLDHSRGRPDAGDALDGSRIDAAVDDAPGRPVARAQLDMRGDARPTDLVEYKSMILNP